ATPLCVRCCAISSTATPSHSARYFAALFLAPLPPLLRGGVLYKLYKPSRPAGGQDQCVEILSGVNRTCGGISPTPFFARRHSAQRGLVLHRCAKHRDGCGAGQADIGSPRDLTHVPVFPLS